MYFLMEGHAAIPEVFALLREKMSDLSDGYLFKL